LLKASTNLNLNALADNYIHPLLLKYPCPMSSKEKKKRSKLGNEFNLEYLDGASKRINLTHSNNAPN